MKSMFENNEQDSQTENGYKVALDPKTKMFCTLYLFKNVENSKELRLMISKGELNCSVLKASLIADPFHVIVAANKAAVNLKINQLTTKTIHTEVLFNLSTSKSISRSLIEFGISDDDKNILIAFIHEESSEEVLKKQLYNIIKGEQVPLYKLSEFRNEEKIKKLYKIEKEELIVSDLTDSVISRISCKDFILVK